MTSPIRLAKRLIELVSCSRREAKLFIAGGWRYEDIAIDEKDIKAEVKFSGPFLEAGVDF